MNGIRCDKFSTAVVTVRAHPEKYKKDFNTVVTFLTQYIDKEAPSVKVESVTQTRPAKQQSDNSSNESLFGDKSPKLITEIIQPLTEREMAPDRAMQTLDG